MSFSIMLELLKEKSKGSIVIVRLGNFYTAVGEDAVLLNKKLELKCSCFKREICKVGFPVNSLKTYINKLDKLKYSYIIYDYDKTEEKLKIVNSKIERSNKEKDKNINCILCKGGEDIGNEYKISLYKILQNAIYINKTKVKLEYLNIIDAELILQRIYLRIMYKSSWIDERKFRISMGLISEIGKIVGGLIKYYANNKK